jgi:hypothetical protein
MSRRAEASKIYEACVATDTLARLAKRFDLKSLPFSDDELQTLAERTRESFKALRSEEKKEQLGSYMAHLSTLYGGAYVGRVATALEQINNEIGYKEK